MKAIVYEGMLEGVRVADVADPKLEQDDDILLRITSTAICGSDLHLIHGMVPNMPAGFILGHEAMGIVKEAGREVTGVKKGDRVIVPFPVSCGHCWYCEHGLWSQCDNSNENGEVGGILGYSDTYGGYDGGQAEYLRVPYANVGPVAVPEDLADEQVLFLTDILPTSLWGVENAGVKAGDTVVVLGCGPVGQLAIQWAWIKGAKRVLAVDNIAYRLQHAHEHGKAEVFDFEQFDNMGEHLKEITHGGADAVVDCVGMDGKMTTLEKIETMMKLQGGSKSAIEIATQAVRKGGTVSLVGVYGARYNMFPLGDFFARNITLKMGQCPAHSYVRPILKMIREGQFDATGIITHTINLRDGAHAYDIFEKRKDNCIKVVLKP